MKPGCTLIAYLHAEAEKREELLKLLQSFVLSPRVRNPLASTIICTSAMTIRTYSSFMRIGARAKSWTSIFRHPFLRASWSRRLDLLEKDVDIKFITMLSEPR